MSKQKKPIVKKRVLEFKGEVPIDTAQTLFVKNMLDILVELKTIRKLLEKGIGVYEIFEWKK